MNSETLVCAECLHEVSAITRSAALVSMNEHCEAAGHEWRCGPDMVLARAEEDRHYIGPARFFERAT